MPSIAGVVFGSTLGDMTHKGPLQAGNKSLLAYKSDVGVPGYTGFNPSSTGILIPIKGSTIHTGRGVDSAVQEQLTTKTHINGHKETEYNDRYRADQSNYHLPSKEGGGYWVGKRTVPVSPPGMFQSSYQAEILQPEKTAAEQLAKSSNLSCTIVNYDSAQRRVHTAPNDLMRTSRGQELPWFKSTYTSMVVKDPIVGGPAAAGAPRSASAQPEFRYRVMPHAMAPAFDGHTTYTQTMGADEGNPQERSAPQEGFQSRMTTLTDLANGSTRVTHQVPGYTGHIPASKYSEMGAVHANSEKTRFNTKTGMLLYDLDQFTRSRLPLYTGYKPQGGPGVAPVQPVYGPTRKTTYGATNADMLRRPNLQAAESHANNSNEGLMGFFTGGTTSVSDNGLSNAQKFYGETRPLEGLFRTQLPSKVLPWGAKFKASSSIV